MSQSFTSGLPMSVSIPRRGCGLLLAHSVCVHALGGPRPRLMRPQQGLTSVAPFTRRSHSSAGRALSSVISIPRLCALKRFKKFTNCTGAIVHMVPSASLAFASLRKRAALCFASRMHAIISMRCGFINRPSSDAWCWAARSRDPAPYLHHRRVRRGAGRKACQGRGHQQKPSLCIMAFLVQLVVLLD